MKRTFLLCATLVAFGGPVLAQATGQTPAFGVYVLVQPGAASAAAARSDGPTVTRLDASARAAAAAPPPTVRANTRVRNQLTREPGVVTGRLSVSTSDAAALNSALASLSLRSLTATPDGTTQVLQAPADADLLALRTQLSQVPGVKEVQIDVQERRLRPR